LSKFTAIGLRIYIRSVASTKPDRFFSVLNWLLNTTSTNRAFGVFIKPYSFKTHGFKNRKLEAFPEDHPSSRRAIL